MKRILKVFLIMLVCISTIGIQSKSTEVNAKILGDYSYELINDESVVITNYNGSAKDLIIPSTLDGKKVTRIGYGAFSECKSLETVEIPDTVITFENYAFSQCTQLKKVNIPDSVVSLGQNAFTGCNSLEQIKIPKNMKSIGYGTFFDCINLQKIEIPEGIETIGGMAFGNCRSLNDISLPSTLTNIGSSSFANCIKLTAISVPDGVITIGTSAFAGCISLQDVHLPNSVMGVGQSAFQDCISLERIVLPDSIEAIGYSAFSGCSSLRQINIPNKLITLGNAMFSGCSSLEEINIPSNIEEIGENTFSGCIKLQSIVIPDSVTVIGMSAFSNCSELRRVELPKKLKIIETSLFRYCASLDTIIIPNSVTEIKATAFADCLNLRSVFVPTSITAEDKLGSRIFSNSLNLIVSVVSGSQAHLYVQRNEIPFKLVGDGLTLDTNNLKIKVGEERMFKAIISPYTIADNTKLTWTSSNEAIVKVRPDGSVIGVSVGKATITAKTSNGFSATCEVTVDDIQLPITAVTLNHSKETIKKENTLGLTATISPQNTTDSKTIQWDSSNTEVATVSSTGKVAAKSPGTTIIRATASNGMYAECEITVISEIKSVSLNVTALTLDTGMKQTLRATINPNDTTDDKTLQWKSSNETIATVSQDGEVLALTEGTATISVITSNGRRAECKIVVSKPEIRIPIESVDLNEKQAKIKKGATVALIASINPSNTTEDKTLQWKSSDETIATVSQDGKVQAIGVGTAIVTVTTSNLKTVTCEIEVYDTLLDDLDKAILKAEELEEDNYTVKSYEALSKILTEAKLVQENIDATQTQIDEITTSLQVAIQQLEKRASLEVISALNEMIETCRSMEADFSVEQYAEMKLVLNEMEAIVNTDARELSESRVNEAIAKLTGLYEDLQVEAHINVLSITMHTAQDILHGDTSNLKPTSIKVLQEALNYASGLMENNNRNIEEIKQANQKLLDAIKNLDTVVDNQLLKDLIVYADKLSEANYTSTSWNRLQETLEKVSILLENKEATKDDIENCYAELIETISELQVRVDKTALDYQISIVEKIVKNITKYQASTVKGIDTLLKEAVVIQNSEEVTQEEVKQMNDLLIKAALKARLKPN